jgi:hypothetical protein
MKKLYVVLFGIMIAALVALAQDVPRGVTLYTDAMGSGSACILPPRGLSGVEKWSSVTGKVLTAGSVWEASNGRYYLVVVGGTSTNSPTNTVGVQVLESTIAWTPVVATHAPRTGLAVYNTSTSHVYAAFGQAAVVGRGIYLAPLTGSLVIPSGAPQSALFAISGTATSLVTAQDF